NYGVGVEGLVGQAPLPGAVDNQFYFFPVDDTAGIERRDEPAVKLIGDGAVKLEKIADPAGYVIFVTCFRHRLGGPKNGANNFFNFDWIVANFFDRGAHAAPRQSIVAADVKQNTEALRGNPDVVR